MGDASSIVRDNGAGGSGRRVLLVVCAALFFGVLNASAVGVTLPQIAEDLAIETGRLSWLMTGFLLIYGIAIPFYGRLADLHGARPLFIFGVAVFAMGSILSALASGFWFLLAARAVQAIGGAAVPGLGMTLASRAYGPQSRGTVLGVIAATIGGGAAVGPLLGGALSQSFGWQSVFVATSLAAVTIPFALLVLPRDEDKSGGKLDLWGGVALGLLVCGVLLVPAEWARAGWSSPITVAGAAMAMVGITVLLVRQISAVSPFIPRELMQNVRYLSLIAMGFSVMAANLSILIALPILLTLFHGLSPLEIGLVMLPGAVFSSAFGVLAGKLTDRFGARLPAWSGAPLMLAAILALSASADSPVFAIATFNGILGAGFGLMNTPIAATVSRIVRGPMLASALGINSMLFFLGGSFGTAVLMAIVNSRTGADVSSLNPFHSGASVGFSDGFLLLALPVLAAIALSLALPKAVSQAASPAAPALKPGVSLEWVADCSMPWMPECVERSEPVEALAPQPALAGR